MNRKKRERGRETAWERGRMREGVESEGERQVREGERESRERRGRRRKGE